MQRAGDLYRISRRELAEGLADFSYAQPLAGHLQCQSRERRAEVMGSLDAAERGLIIELAAHMLNEIEPAEVPLLEQTAADYFANPNAMLSRRGGDEPLGFGLDLALMGPYTLAVASSVVTFVGSIIADEARDAARPVVSLTPSS